MSGEDLEWAVETLVEAERRRCISRVCRMETEDAVGKGDNYASDIRRLKMTVVLHSGEVQRRSLIYKAIPETPQSKEMAKKFGSFTAETKVFTDILPELEIILREKDVNAEILWPELIGVKRKFEGLLLEDLTASGFKMADRQKRLDFEHAAVVLRCLAKFHALTAILNENGDLNAKIYEHPFLLTDDVEKLCRNSFKELASVLERKWKGQWVQFAERIRKSVDTIMMNCIKALKRENEDKFFTLLHGDCWVNNIMFRYDRKGNPETVRFIDFQLCNFNHPTIDLEYFFETSLNLETRPRKTELLQMYHSSLEDNLAYYGFGGKVPTYQNFLECRRDARYYGLAMAIVALPFMLLPPERAPDMEELSGMFMNDEAMQIQGFDYEGENFVNTIKYILKEADDDGLIQ